LNCHLFAFLRERRLDDMPSCNELKGLPRAGTKAGALQFFIPVSPTFRFLESACLCQEYHLTTFNEKGPLCTLTSRHKVCEGRQHSSVQSIHKHLHKLRTLPRSTRLPPANGFCGIWASRPPTRLWPKRLTRFWGKSHVVLQSRCSSTPPRPISQRKQP
jgi:hypothetical protein